MATTNTVQVGVNVSDNGTVEELQNKIKNLKREFSALKNAMKQTDSGSAGAIGMSAKQENIAYRNARGVAGTGGGDSRDFAKQAQGLGGLVHVYATFAANIFAVGAAFTALSKAMANANMVAAADQLSATLGVNVKVIAADIQKLTDYTLSYQDAIRAANVGLQSGISAKNVKELVVIAKGAANVMGRDVQDSIDRVIRGTAKQEQEILDELGIIIRSKQAWDEYAKAIGKSGAEALTAAEKQEGYTQAVIKAGQKQKEFANSFANPYDKLLASVTEVGNSMLNGLNAIFGPIAKYLAENKAAIFGIISALTAFLLTKAIPTLRIIGDNLQDEREKNLAYSKRLVDSYSKQGALFNDKERTNIQAQLQKSENDFKNYGEKVKATFANIAGAISKSNVELKKSLQMNPADLAANADKLKQQMERSERGMIASAKQAKEGTGIYKNLDETTRLEKEAQIKARINVLQQEKIALFGPEKSHLNAVTTELEKQNVLKARANAISAEGIGISTKAEAAIQAINLKRDQRANTLNQSQKFADVLNNPISTIGDKFSTFKEGFKAAGKPLTVGEEGPLQPKKIGMLTAGIEKATYSFQTLSLAGEAVIGVLGKLFVWFTILSTVWSVVKWAAEATGLWTKHSEKLTDAQKDVTAVLGTQKDMLIKNKELLTATDLDTASYISKWKMLSENFSQITEKLKEAKAAQDEYNKSAGSFNKWWDEFSGKNKDAQEEVEGRLKRLLTTIGISNADKQTIEEFLKNKDKNRPKSDVLFGDDRKRSFEIAQYNKKIAEDEAALEIKVNENAEKMAASNLILMKSFQNLGESANDAFSKAFDKKEHGGYASELGQTLSEKLIKPFDNLLERYKTGAIDQKAFRDGISSFTSEMDKIGPSLKKAIPEFNAYLAALIKFESALNIVKNAKPGTTLADMKKQMAEQAIINNQFLSILTAEANELIDARDTLDKKLKVVAPPKEAAKSGLSADDRSEARSLANQVKTINTQIRTNDALLKDTTAINARNAAVRGYNAEIELNVAKNIQLQRADLEYNKSKTQAELENLKIQKDVGSTAQAKEEGRLALEIKNAEASNQKALAIKAANDAYNSGAIDAYIKKNNQLLELSNLQLNSERSRLENLFNLNKLTEKEKITKTLELDTKGLTDKLNTEKANLEKQYMGAGSVGISYEAYTVAGNKLQAEYDIKLGEITEKEKANLAVLARRQEMAGLENDITAIQNRINMEQEAGIISIDLINQRAAIEEKLFLKKMETTNIEEQNAFKIERTNKLYQDQLSIFGQINKQVQDVGTTLTTVFGNLGTAIGGSIKALVDSAQDLQKIEMSYASDKEAAGTDTKALADAEIKYSKEKGKAELNSISSVAGASKKLFNEKSTAFKVLAKVEKAAAAASLALQIKDLAVRLGILTTKVTAEGATETAILGIKIASAPKQVAADSPGILSSFAKLGPWGYAAGAAIVAMLLSMVGGGGKGKMVDMTGLTSEDRQAVQGTGQSYVNGIRVDNGGGVFGDSSAKSTAIADSLAVMEGNSIIGLNYDNRMLKALEKLADSIVGAAKSLYSIPGLRAGTNFGTMEGTTSKGGFGSKIPVIGGVLSSIFGGGTTSTASITSAGLQLTGTFDDVMNNITGSILQYKDVLTQYSKKGGWFSSDKNWSTLTTQTNALAADVTASISDIFKDANALFIELGKKTDVSAEFIASTLKTLKISMPIDLMGLTGDALVQELDAVIGNQLSKAANILFSGFNKFKNFGEDYLTTVVRVIDANNKVDQALRSIGSSFSIIGKFDISEGLVKMAGGLSNFMEQTAAFNDSFLTDAERLIPIQKDVTKQLVNLGLSSTLTRDQFKALVVSLDVSTAGGQAMYQSLMELVPGFDMVTKATEAFAEEAEKAAKALQSSKLELDTSIYTELGKAEQALQLTRQKELESLDATLKPIQIYLNSLKDETSLKAKLTKSYTEQSNAIKNTISSLTNSVKSLREYRAALTAGSNSLLTPTEKYSQAQATMYETAATARMDITATSTPEEIAARNEAIGKISSTTDAFLNASKELFASSDRYAQDYSSVLALIDSTSSSLTTQLSNAEKQLVALDESVSFLNLIATSSDTTASLLKEMVELQKATEATRLAAVSAGSTAAASVRVPALAGGGMASGLTIVGENGPELANFTSQARIYSNPASNDIFNTAELVSEIKSLRKEVSQLRADQKEQTGHLIAANYDANAKNAEMVAESTDAALADQSWKVRSQVKIA